MGSMSIPSEKQGQLGDLTKKTLPELRELLDRQDKLLKKEKFLQTLPDKGVKVKMFAETLRTLITQREEVDQAASKLEGVKISDLVQKQTTNTHSDKKVQTFGTNQVHQKGDISKTEADLCEVLVTRKNIELTGDNSSAMDVSERLSEVLERVTISTDQPVSGREDVYVNSYERVIKKANEQTPHKKTFKPNSTLKISKVEDLPEVYKFRSKQGNVKDSPTPGGLARTERKTESAMDSSNPKPKEESAVVLPDYKHDKSVLISVEESLQLVTQQREQHGELMMRQATERLAGRLHIRLDDYNPEGTNMNYRVPATDTDSDDEPEIDGYNED
ncbi:DNA-directed RNA polymerase II subunit GRINL1A-like [Haliotis rubra]|uniref:DNA-directed RNA polymerase II subunit GRINL1A-like n=1 Tax=Haliotis rubra TaxID=36100 RepID=UPI001EE4F29C|nr:DNA-directed RNA polymerase II subunit GRINL1A-like [Haliotis rubra]